MILLIILLPSCTANKNPTESGLATKSKTPTNPCSPGNPQGPTKSSETLLGELIDKIQTHPDLQDTTENMEDARFFIISVLTTSTYDFPDTYRHKTSRFPTINLLPHLSLCCEHELKASQYQSFGTCLDRSFARVLNADRSDEYHNFVIGKNILYELSPKGRRGWCEYIDSEWVTFKTQKHSLIKK